MLKVACGLLVLTGALVVGCDATDISESDAQTVNSAVSDVDTFCDVVDGKKSVSLDSFDELDQDAANAVKRLISVYKKDPAGTYIPANVRDEKSRSIRDLLQELSNRLSSCDPKDSSKIMRALKDT